MAITVENDPVAKELETRSFDQTLRGEDSNEGADMAHRASSERISDG